MYSNCVFVKPLKSQHVPALIPLQHVLLPPQLALVVMQRSAAEVRPAPVQKRIRNFIVGVERGGIWETDAALKMGLL